MKLASPSASTPPLVDTVNCPKPVKVGNVHVVLATTWGGDVIGVGRTKAGRQRSTNSAARKLVYGFTGLPVGSRISKCRWVTLCLAFPEFPIHPMICPIDTF